VSGIENLTSGLNDTQDLLEMAVEENDEETVASLEEDIASFASQVEAFEFRRMFSGEMDANNAYIEIQSGSGGTEAQDWAEILLRMYLRWCEKRGWKTELIECSAGDVAGIKSATIKVDGGVCFTRN